MGQENDSSVRKPPEATIYRNGCLWVSLLLLVTIVLTVLLTLWVARTWLFSAQVDSVELTVAEQRQLDEKLKVLTGERSPASSSVRPEQPPLRQPPQPERYEEKPEQRVVYFTERELNAMIARNPELADRMALHLSDDLLSVTWLVDLPPDFPVFGGQKVRLASGLRLSYQVGRPVLALEGVSVMGVPLPSAWLGGIKGLDLIGSDVEGGLWQVFGEGIADLKVEQGRLKVELAE